MRSIGDIAAIVAIGAGLGLASAYYALATGFQPTAVEIGPWRVIAGVGQRDADPYARAVTARTGDLPLGTGEGILFLATTDSEGRSLSGACVYRIAAQVPPARAWSLTLTDREGRVVDNPSRRYALTAAALLRPLSGAPQIVIAAEPQAGNWLPAPDRTPFELALRLYESPVANAIAAIRPESMPRIDRESCR